MGHEGQPHTSGRSSFTVSRQDSVQAETNTSIPSQEFQPDHCRLQSDEWAMLRLDLPRSGFVQHQDAAIGSMNTL